MNTIGMRIRNFSVGICITLGFAGILLHGQNTKEGAGRGVVIIAAKSGPTQFLDSVGKVLPAKMSGVGSALPEGNVAQAGIGGKIVLLLSNGTVMTLDSQTKLTIREFTQEPFDAAGRKVSDLAAEPSKSNVKLDLDWGSIVVETKKLDRASSLNINSPAGSAGVRGTQFQMSQNPGSGVTLDVSESTVAFTPPGAAQPVAVGAGQGLDVSAAGVATPRPISPVAAQNITVTNTAAAQSTGDVSLSAVSDSMTQATTEAGEADSGGDSGSAEEGEGAADGEGDGSSGESDNSGDGEGDGGSDGGGDTETASEGDASGGGETGGGETSSETSAEPASPESSSTPETSTTESAAPSAEPAAPVAPEVAAPAPEVDTSQVLENNTDAVQSRKTGKVSERSQEVARIGLSDDQALRFYSYGTGLQDALLASGPEVARRLLGLTEKGVSEKHLENFFAYAPDVQGKLLALNPDDALANLLAKEYKESWLAGLLSSATLVGLNAGDSGESTPEFVNLEGFLSLSDKLRESGNSEILEELRELGGGTLSDELLLEGENANRLLSDFSGPNELAASNLVKGEDALSNRFYLDVSAVYGALESDALVAGEAIFLSGRSVTLSGGSYDLNALDLGDAFALVLGGVEQLTLEGSMSFGGEAGQGRRIVLMSGDSLDASKGLTIDAATNDLVLSVRRDVELEDATLLGNREVVVRSLRDLTVRNGEVEASSLAKLKAAKDLYVDGLRFNQQIPKLVMEATTIRLRNVDFPAAAKVNLNSLKGALDGRYPNFGTNVPVVQQLGRVNFLENVKSGGNLMHNRATFDQFGKNITIGKMVSP
jgi:hypothetical protein